jgi:hypothetical protein
MAEAEKPKGPENGQDMENGRQKGKKVENMSPFIVKSIEAKGTAYRNLDKITAHGLEGYERAAKRAEEYALYFHEHDINTERYCRKVALITELADEENEDGLKIRELIKALLKKHWPDAYGYIEKAPAPLSFDKFYFLALKIRRGAPPTKSRGWDCDLPMFIYIANLLGKEIDYMTPEYSKHFKNLAAEEERIKNRNVFEFTLSAEKAELAEKLWRGLEGKFGGRVPATINQYFNSEVNRKDEKNSFLFSFGNIAGLPLGAIREAFVNSLKLKREIEYLVWRQPDGDARLTGELEEMAMRVFVQSLFLRAIATEYGKERTYALKYWEIQGEAERNINKRKFQEMKIEIEQLKKENKTLKWKNQLLEGKLPEL